MTKMAIKMYNSLNRITFSTYQNCTYYATWRYQTINQLLFNLPFTEEIVKMNEILIRPPRRPYILLEYNMLCHVHTIETICLNLLTVFKCKDVL